MTIIRQEQQKKNNNSLVYIHYKERKTHFEHHKLHNIYIPSFSCTTQQEKSHKINWQCIGYLTEL